MKEVLIGITVLVVVVLMHFSSRTIDNLIRKIHRQSAEESNFGSRHVRLAAEKTAFFEDIASALKQCTRAEPDITFAYRSGTAKRLLRQLVGRKLEIVLLTEEPAKGLNRKLAWTKILLHKDLRVHPELGLPVEEPMDEQWVYAVWNKEVRSDARDSTIFALEHEHVRARRGYRDYLDT